MSIDTTLPKPKVVTVNPKLLNKLIAIANNSNQIHQHASIITKGKTIIAEGANSSCRQRILNRLVPCVHSETNVLAQLKYRLLRDNKISRYRSKVWYRQREV